MRFTNLVIAALVIVLLYMLVLEREAMFDLAGGDRTALGRIGIVESLLGREPASEAAPDQAAGDAAQAGAAPAPTERRTAVVAIAAQRQQIEQAVILRGRTEALRQRDITAETSGRIVSEMLSRGTAVERDTLLCELEPGSRPARLAEAEARVAEAEIELRNAEALSGEGFASEARVLSARAGVQAARAGLAQAQEEVDRLEIRAPFAGLLVSDTADAGDILQPGASCATLIQIDPMLLAGYLPEPALQRIALGAQAGARLLDGRLVTGVVTHIAQSADPATRTFRVEVSFDNADGRVRDGQAAEIGILGTQVSAHLVPASALTLDDDGRLGVRLVDADSRARFAPVEVVRFAPEGVWISGLDEQADVIVVGQEYLAEGAQVAPTFRDAPEASELSVNPLAALQNPAAAAAAMSLPEALR